MQARIMDQVKYLEPLSNNRIALSVDQAMRSLNLLTYSAGDAQFNHVMRENGNSQASPMLGTDFEVITRD